MRLTVGLAEAKARFPELVDRVEAGETIVISRDGVAVAEMRPVRRKSPAEVVTAIKALQERLARRNARKEAWPVTDRSLRDATHDGHRR